MQTLENSIARIEKVIWLGGQVYADAMSDEMEQFIEDQPLATVPQLRPIFDLAEGEELSTEETADEMRSYCHRKGLLGFLFSVAVPVTTNHHAGGYSYSWGHYTSSWFYAESTDAMVEKALAYAGERLLKDRARAA